MKVPLLDLKPQLKTIEKELKAAINEVIDSTQYIMGARVEELEKQIAEYVGAKFAIGVTSGTDALLISLMALDVKPGDIVITTPYSFFATAGVISRMNALPAFVEIDPNTYNMNPEALQKWLEENKDKQKKIRAIIPIHLYGQCADMDQILEIAERYNIPVIEDAAQAIGAPYPSKNGVKKAGSMGVFGCFSFFPSKNLGCIGDGGMVTTNDPELGKKVRLLRNHGAEPKYYHSMIGGNFRLDAIQAAALLVKLPHLESWHKMRRENAAYYDEHLQSAFRNFTLRSFSEGGTHSAFKTPAIAYKREHHIYNQYIISVPERRDDLKKFLLDSGIGCEIYYPVPIHLQECFAYLGYQKRDFPESEYAADHTLALPIFPELTRAMQDYVIEKISEFYRV